MKLAELFPLYELKDAFDETTFPLHAITRLGRSSIARLHARVRS